MIWAMSKKRAIANGFTHHGRLFGIPVWLGDVDSGAPAVAGKNIVFDFLLDIGEAAFGAYVWICRVEDPAYPILVGPPIDQEGSQ